MKKFEELSKKERAEYISSMPYKRDSKHRTEDAAIQYLFDNNPVEEIEEWFKHSAATAGFNGADLISVYTYNRILKKLK